MNTWDELVSQLHTIPDLPGARCRGRHELFDATITGHRGDTPDNLEYARTAAAQLCATCPALHDCAAWLDTQPPHNRPLGITAGRLITINRSTQHIHPPDTQKPATEPHSPSTSHQEPDRGVGITTTEPPAPRCGGSLHLRTESTRKIDNRRDRTMTTPLTDRRRAAELLLACLDDDADAINRILDGAHVEDGGLQGLLAALASGCLELLLGAAGGEDGARKTLSMVLLDAQVDSDHG